MTRSLGTYTKEGLLTWKPVEGKIGFELAKTRDILARWEKLNCHRYRDTYPSMNAKYMTCHLVVQVLKPKKWQKVLKTTIKSRFSFFIQKGFL